MIHKQNTIDPIATSHSYGTNLSDLVNSNFKNAILQARYTNRIETTEKSITFLICCSKSSLMVIINNNNIPKQQIIKLQTGAPFLFFLAKKSRHQAILS